MITENKIQQITNILNSLVESTTTDDAYNPSVQSYLEKINEAKKLLTGCEDTSQIVVAYTRCELDDFIKRKSTDEEWEEAWGAIHNNDTAWSYMSDACYSAECSLGEEE